MLDKKEAGRKIVRSAHLLLWICRAFSTVEPFLHVDSVLAGCQRRSGGDGGASFFLQTRRRSGSACVSVRTRQWPTSFFFFADKTAFALRRLFLL
jgi:hypothetical protein